MALRTDKHHSRGCDLVHVGASLRTQPRHQLFLVHGKDGRSEWIFDVGAKKEKAKTELIKLDLNYAAEWGNLAVAEDDDEQEMESLEEKCPLPPQASASRLARFFRAAHIPAELQQRKGKGRCLVAKRCSSPRSR